MGVLLWPKRHTGMPLKLGVTHVEALLVAPAEIKHGKVLGPISRRPGNTYTGKGGSSRD